MTHTTHTIHWLHHAGQRLGLVPSLGGGVAAWQLERKHGGVLDLWRPWDGDNPDLYSLASFAMLPWSNRISGGGFEHGGQFHPMVPNRVGEAYPIHGDGWLQPWALTQPDQDTLVMTLQSHRFGGNPYNYRATQTFQLLDGGLNQTVSVTHLGQSPLPYGLGLHPWFLRTPQTQLQAGVQGVWLSGADPLPTAHTTDLPPTWDLNQGIDVNGTLVDNAYTGWSGLGRIEWPEHQLRLDMCVPAIHDHGTDDGYCLLYRPPAGSAFCFEPVTHTIDAFHAPGQPGLRKLQTGENLSLEVQWRFHTQER
ncbi:MAG: aldose 1-epimerase [Polaromonas sp.]|nr:aldose 1-epimerase [Polaromonas sp.]